MVRAGSVVVTCHMMDMRGGCDSWSIPGCDWMTLLNEGNDARDVLDCDVATGTVFCEGICHSSLALQTLA